ncbi:c-type cytochrome [Bartonella krasnovii]|uniref:Cytochrome c family protein n=1 Tax=Bartonella krasnovii TaxID=2267275 RepID=A0A5B9D050_9HYPH|nr:cytochrome c family protein [Bartonella krasnovii]QEE11569.1 cytochrome c family protein [Bartonella krasnovii]UNF29322.1 cytochrome c family protein [Bartonella krasnovii]UNF35679.1 cytochrome c family protein [Bartonella krasnovii]UNF37300.1 cytochrome c family protein [Bartonella krasnovii]UNF38992.1 cytochrome c family protein [Bartonella krasnovii]
MNRSKVIYFICACLCVGVVVVGISTLSDIVYDYSPSAQYHHTVTKNDTFKEKQKESDIAISLNSRLQQGNFENGRKIFRQCAICHTSGRNQAGRVGPVLWEIVNRPLAAAAGFAYSRALRAHSDQKWDFVTLDRYLHSPHKAFPGTIMSFRGIKNDQDRADLLLYLRSLSDHPVTIPTDNDKESEPN